MVQICELLHVPLILGQPVTFSALPYRLLKEKSGITPLPPPYLQNYEGLETDVVQLFNIQHVLQ